MTNNGKHLIEELPFYYFAYIPLVVIQVNV